MSAVLSPSAVDRRRSPKALVVVGLPTYFVIVGFSIRDLFDHQPRGHAVAAVMVIAVFSAIFVWLALIVEERPERRILGAILTMTALAIVISLLGSTSAAYLVTAGAMAGDALRPRLAIVIIAVASVALGIVAVANDFDVVSTLTTMFIPVMVGLFASGVRRLVEANRELDAAREEVARLAVVDERLRFARDLHDVLGHSLTVIRAKSELASRLAATDAAAAGREMAEVERIARESLAEVRETVTGYRRLALGQELRDARDVLHDAGVDVSVTEAPAALRPDVDDVLAWVLREGVTNVIRHSGASSCHIETTCDGGNVRLIVTDNGRGAADRRVGNGLLGARERLARVDGTLEAAATANGFRLVATVPAPP